FDDGRSTRGRQLTAACDDERREQNSDATCGVSDRERGRVHQWSGVCSPPRLSCRGRDALANDERGGIVARAPARPVNTKTAARVPTRGHVVIEIGARSLPPQLGPKARGPTAHGGRSRGRRARTRG